MNQSRVRTQAEPFTGRQRHPLGPEPSQTPHGLGPGRPHRQARMEEALGQTRPASGPPACSPLYWKCSPLPSLNQSVLPSRAVSSEKLPEPRRAPCRVCRHPTRPHGAASAVAMLSSAQSVDVCLLPCDEVGDDLCPFRHRNPASVAPAAPRAQKALIAVF